MKKTIGKYMVVGMVALTMTACNDSFLWNARRQTT